MFLVPWPELVDFSIILGELRDLANEPLCPLFIYFAVFIIICNCLIFGLLSYENVSSRRAVSTPVCSPLCLQCLEQCLVHSRFSVKNLC